MATGCKVLCSGDVDMVGPRDRLDILVVRGHANNAGIALTGPSEDTM